MDIELTRPIDKFTLVPDRLQRSLGRVFFFVPYRTKVYLCARIYDIECYATELSLFVPVAGLMALGALVHVCVSRDARLVKEEWSRILEGEEEWMERYMPRMMWWLRVVTQKLERESGRVRRVQGELSLKPLLRPTPEEAVLKDSLYVRRRSEGPRQGAVRIYYFKDPSRAKPRPNPGHGQAQRSSPDPDSDSEPDAWLDITVDPQNGVDLGSVRRRWGLESLAILRPDTNHVDDTFYPADPERLSPLAAYELSGGWREAIRVFEPHTSILTPLARTLRNTLHPPLFFLFTLTTLLLGFPQEDNRYLEALYGPTFSAFHQSAATFLARARRDLLDLVLIFLCLPFFLVYHTYRGVKGAVGWAFSTMLGVGRAAVRAVRGVVAGIASWDWTVWFAVGLVGVTVVEYRA